MNIGMVLLVALIVGSILYGTQCSRPDFHGRAAGGFVFAILWILWWSVGFPKIMQRDRNDFRQDQQHADAWQTPIAVSPNVLPPPSALPEPGKPEKRTDVASLPTREPPSTTGKTAAEKPAADEPPPAQAKEPATWPDWMNQPPATQGDTYVVAVASGVYSDSSVREQMLDAKLAAAANRYIDDILYRQGGVSDIVSLDPEYLQSFVRARTVSPENNETYVKLEFNQRFRDEVDRRYKQFLSLGRLWQLGIAASGAFVVLGGAYLYLRLTQPARPVANSVPASA